MKKLSVIFCIAASLALVLTLAGQWGASSRAQSPPDRTESSAAQSAERSGSGFSEERFGLLPDPAGVVPDSKCAECHPRNVRLMHRHLTVVGQAKTREFTQGMVNLAVDCQPDGADSFTCRPRPEANCFRCHAVSVSADTLSLIDLEKMKAGRGDDEILGHSCLTCHPPRGEKNHHLSGNLRAITKPTNLDFVQGCRGCHSEGLASITGGGSPHDWLARHLDELPPNKAGADQ